MSEKIHFNGRKIASDFHEYASRKKSQFEAKAGKIKDKFKGAFNKEGGYQPGPVNGNGQLVEAPRERRIFPRLNPGRMLRPQGGIRLPRPVEAMQRRIVDASINQAVQTMGNLPNYEPHAERVGEEIGRSFSFTGFLGGATRLTSAFVRGVLRGSDNQQHYLVRHTTTVWNAVGEGSRKVWNGAYAALTAVHRTWNWLRGN